MSQAAKLASYYAGLAEEQARREWMKRPSAEMQFGLDDWIAMKVSKNTTLAAMQETIQSAEMAQPITPGGRVQHVSGQMNGLEKKYAAHLETRKLVGEIQDYRFEPMKLRLAKSTFFDIDFLIVRQTRNLQGTITGTEVELHETKGHWEDDARVKMKVAAKMFPWWRFVGVQWIKNAKTWKFEEFKA